MMTHKLFTLGLTFILLLVACQTPAAPTAVPTSAPPQPATSEPVPPVPTEAPPITEPVDQNDDSEVIVPAPPVEIEEDAEPITVRIGWIGSPDTLNLGMAQSLYAGTIFNLTYDTLYRLEFDGSIALGLAKAVDVSDDGLVWIFTIGEGFTFHDGQPLTANDIVFTYNLVSEQEDFPILPQYVSQIASVEAPDDYTVVITLSETNPSLEIQLSQLYILPEHIWANLEPEGGAVTFTNEALIGSGAFRLVAHETSEIIHLAAVESHPLYTPAIHELIFHTFEDSDQMVAAMLDGQLDMLTHLPSQNVAELSEDPNIVVVTGSPILPEVTTIFFNMMTPENCPPEYGVCDVHPALTDRNVRLALAHATNKQGLIDDIFLGYGEPGLTLIPSGLGIWYNDTLTDYAYNIALANQILDEAGYLDTDDDGIRETADGQPLSFRFYWPEGVVNAPQLAEAVAPMWQDIGVALEQEELDFDSLLAVCCPTYDYDLILWGWGSEPDPTFLLSLMTTAEIESGLNETGYINPAYDALFTQQANQLDLDERIATVREMQAIALNDIAYIIPNYPVAIQAYRRDRFTGWITDQDKLALETILSLTAIEPVR